MQSLAVSLLKPILDGKDISVQLQEWIAVKANGSSRISKYWKQLAKYSIKIILV